MKRTKFAFIILAVWKYSSRFKFNKISESKVETQTIAYRVDDLIQNVIKYIFCCSFSIGFSIYKSEIIISDKELLSKLPEAIIDLQIRLCKNGERIY